MLHPLPCFTAIAAGSLLARIRLLADSMLRQEPTIMQAIRVIRCDPHMAMLVVTGALEASDDKILDNAHKRAASLSLQSAVVRLRGAW